MSWYITGHLWECIHDLLPLKGIEGALMRTNFQEENLKKGDEKTCNHYSNSGPTKHKRKRNTWPYGAYGATVLGTKSSSSFFSAQTKALILLIRPKEPRFFIPLLRLPFAIIVIVCLSFVVVEGKNTNLARILSLYLALSLSLCLSLSPSILYRKAV